MIDNIINLIIFLGLVSACTFILICLCLGVLIIFMILISKLEDDMGLYDEDKL